MSWGFVFAGVALVPLLGWLLERAGAPVPFFGAVGLVAVGLAVVGWRWGSGAWAPWWWPVPWVLTVVGVPLSLADARHRRLPDVLTLPAYPAMAVAVGLAAVGGGGPAVVVDALAGAAVFGGAHWAVHRMGRMGAGDVKLAGVLGAVLGVLGWVSLVFAAVAAAGLSAALAVRLRAAAGGGGPPVRCGVPHGPALILATWTCAVFPGLGSGVVPS
ncbi:prepilin peptidase [Amycolatopsis sp. NPDC004368]